MVVLFLGRRLCAGLSAYSFLRVYIISMNDDHDDDGVDKLNLKQMFCLLVLFFQFFVWK